MSDTASLVLPPALPPLPPECLCRAQALMAGGQRKILGIVAPPGAGKSTLARQLVQALGDAAQLVPMDGFHLSNAELRRLNRHQRKGAPDTFDSAGYVHLLRRLRAGGMDTKADTDPDAVVYAPDFDRSLEESIAASIAIPARTPLIVTEGNYLLLQDGPWKEVRALIDDMWFLEVDDTLRRSRLLERHMHFGRTREAALQWIESTDEPNARRILETRPLADWTVRW